MSTRSTPTSTSRSRCSKSRPPSPLRLPKPHRGGIRPPAQNQFLMQVVMGIDPGAANLGFGVVRVDGNRMVALDGGVVATGPEMPMERRRERIHAPVGELMAAHQPGALAIEQVYFGRNVGSAMMVGQASG